MTINLKENPELGAIAKFILVVFVLAFICFCFFGAKFYFADFHYKKAMASQNSEALIGNLEKAIGFNSLRSQYKISLAKTALSEVSLESAKLAIESDTNKIEEIKIKIERMTILAIAQAKDAVEISENSVAAQEALGMVYRDIKFLAEDADVWAVKIFEEALSLEPANPALETELGKARFYLEQKNASEDKSLTADFKEAIQHFNNAIELKNDWWEAHSQMAIILEAKGNYNEAIEKLENINLQYDSSGRSVFMNPQFVEIIFQLGRLYYNNGQIEKAIGQFNQVIEFSPNHSNAHYSLGVAYIKQGQREKALVEFEKVLELNPNSEDVKAKIRELR